MFQKSLQYDSGCKINPRSKIYRDVLEKNKKRWLNKKGFDIYNIYTFIRVNMSKKAEKAHGWGMGILTKISKLFLLLFKGSM